MTASAVRMAADTPTLVEGGVDHIGTGEADTTRSGSSRTLSRARALTSRLRAWERCTGLTATSPLDHDVTSAVWEATTALRVEQGADSLSRLDVSELVATRVAKINFGPELQVVVHETTTAWYPAAALDAPDHRLLTRGWKSATKGQVLKRLYEIRAA